MTLTHMSAIADWKCSSRASSRKTSLIDSDRLWQEELSEVVVALPDRLLHQVRFVVVQLALQPLLGLARLPVGLVDPPRLVKLWSEVREELGVQLRIHALTQLAHQQLVGLHLKRWTRLRDDLESCYLGMARVPDNVA
eukprot:CAMPEP_0205942596 /NCGR_PEP_ID=MMETSP1325-20131115/58031_1 /ASSEMBLY_ACC=CAM_ASM_000708 /TAXON_ID=236786 /ORGANISM="Florenciella sp., Strain RCC1007" /LENGTH=137 /DNA_ID=CAMNT_0053313331 /DNA_START=28 /DNA_END=439 /DNA_ORIENTATION=-